MKIVINTCWGGFGLSDEALAKYAELKGRSAEDEIFGYTVERNDPVLVQVVEELKSKANGSAAKLKVVEIPDDVEWEIANHDGMETVEEVHQSWS